MRPVFGWLLLALVGFLAGTASAQLYRPLFGRVVFVAAAVAVAWWWIAELGVHLWGLR